MTPTNNSDLGKGKPSETEVATNDDIIKTLDEANDWKPVGLGVTDTGYERCRDYWHNLPYKEIIAIFRDPDGINMLDWTIMSGDSSMLVSFISKKDEKTGERFFSPGYVDVCGIHIIPEGRVTIAFPTNEERYKSHYQGFIDIRNYSEEELCRLIRERENKILLHNEKYQSTCY